MRAEVCDLIKQAAANGCHECGYGQKHDYAQLHLHFLRLEQLKVPVSKIIDALKAVPCTTCNANWSRAMATAHGGKLAGKLKAIQKKLTICLDCVRGASAEGCRYQHK